MSTFKALRERRASVPMPLPLSQSSLHPHDARGENEGDQDEEPLASTPSKDPRRLALAAAAQGKHGWLSKETLLDAQGRPCAKNGGEWRPHAVTKNRRAATVTLALLAALLLLLFVSAQLADDSLARAANRRLRASTAQSRLLPGAQAQGHVLLPLVGSAGEESAASEEPDDTPRELDETSEDKDEERFMLRRDGLLVLARQPRIVPAPTPVSPVPAPAATDANDDDDDEDASEITDEDGAHPVRHLIQRGAEMWRHMHARQSRSVRAAVREYRRRYGHNPPRGFDQWWWFARANEVELPDEYNSIAQSFAPLLEVHPAVLRKQIEIVQTDPRSPLHAHHIAIYIERGAVVGVTDAGSRDALAALAELPNSRARIDAVRRARARGTRGFTSEHKAAFALEVAAVVKRFAPHLPDMTLIFNAAPGGPQVLSPRSALQSTHELLPHERWAYACHPDSPRLEHGTLDDARVSFVGDPLAMADYCQTEARWDAQRDDIMVKPPRYVPIVPMLSPFSTTLHSDVVFPLLPPLSALQAQPWRGRENDRLFWRGAENATEQTQAGRLHKLAHPDVGVRSLLHPAGDAQSAYDARELARHYLDVEQGQAARTGNESLKFAAVVDSPREDDRFRELLENETVVLRPLTKREWWTDKIQPWLHYVPVRTDFADALDVLAFLRGLPSEQTQHTDAEWIAAHGRDFVRRHWRPADVQAYAYRVALEWARVMNRRHVDDFAWDFVLSQ